MIYSLVWDVTRRCLVVSDLSGQLIVPFSRAKQSKEGSSKNQNCISLVTLVDDRKSRVLRWR